MSRLDHQMAWWRTVSTSGRSAVEFRKAAALVLAGECYAPTMSAAAYRALLRINNGGAPCSCDGSITPEHACMYLLLLAEIAEEMAWRE